MKGLPEGVAKGVPEVQGARGLHPFCDLLLKCDAYGGNSLGLDRPLDQAHGLVAKTSGGGEKNGFGPLPNQAVSDLWGRLLHERFQMRTINVTHEAIQGGGDPSDNPLILEFLESIDGEDYVDVAVCCRMIVILVRDGKITLLDMGRKGPKPFFAFPRETRRRAGSSVRSAI